MKAPKIMVNTIVAVTHLEHRQTWMRIVEVTLRMEVALRKEKQDQVWEEIQDRDVFYLQN